MKRFIVDNDKGGARGLKAFGFGKAGEGDGWFEFARRVRGTWEKGGFCPIVREVKRNLFSILSSQWLNRFLFS